MQHGDPHLGPLSGAKGRDKMAACGEENLVFQQSSFLSECHSQLCDLWLESEEQRLDVNHIAFSRRWRGSSYVEAYNILLASQPSEH